MSDELSTIQDRDYNNATINKPTNVPIGIIYNDDGSVKFNYSCVMGSSYRHLGYDGFTVQLDMNLGSFNHTTGTNINSMGHRNEIVLFSLNPHNMNELNDGPILHGGPLSIVIIDFYIYVEYTEPLISGFSTSRTMMRLYNVNDFPERKIHTFVFMPLESGLMVKAYVTDSATDISDNNLIASAVIPNIGNIYLPNGENFHRIPYLEYNHKNFHH